MDTLETVQTFELAVFEATQRGAPAGGRRVTSNGVSNPPNSIAEWGEWGLLHLGNETFMCEDGGATYRPLPPFARKYSPSRFCLLSSQAVDAAHMRSIVDGALDEGYGDICVLGVMNGADDYQVLPDFWGVISVLIVTAGRVSENKKCNLVNIVSIVHVTGTST